ncbi:MAG: DUF4374 domain-containing protein, partial [Tannerellaceae bacterium]|nr:DUF4374 domain-containing protein [Tannerellaceae bacterium]
YVVSADDLMEGNINAVGKGIEQNGFHDYEQGNQTIFCVGGMGVTLAKGVTRGVDGYLKESGDFVFDNQLRAFSQINETTMLGVEIPDNAESGDSITFYQVDINTLSLLEKKRASILPLSELEWPSITGLCMSENKIYMAYFHMNPKTFDTPLTDTTYIAVYNYPEMELETIIKDTRTGPAGSWYAHNGIFKVESGDMYIMSNSSMANGFSQATKTAAFVRIPKGSLSFDKYYFDFEAISGGLKPAHIKYIGNGLIFAEVSTLNPQTRDDRWSDKDLKCCIIDLNKQTVTDVEAIPVHNGNGGRRFTAMVDKGMVYFPVTNAEGTYIYRIDPHTATAEKGAKVSTTFVGGLFKLN